MICAVVLNIQAPQNLVWVLSRPLDFPALSLFLLASVCPVSQTPAQPCAGYWTVGVLMAWSLPSRGSQDPGSGDRRSPLSFGSFLLHPCVPYHHEHSGGRKRRHPLAIYTRFLCLGEGTSCWPHSFPDTHSFKPRISQLQGNEY